MNKLIYVMDPQCGWCYGNGDNIVSLLNTFKQEFEFDLLLGGMWLHPNAPKGGPQLSQYLQNVAPRMAATTGVEVSPDFYQLANNEQYVFSSLAPCAAIQWVKEHDKSKALRFSKEVQSALFLKGQRLDQLKTYEPILTSLDLDLTAFGKEWLRDSNLESTSSSFAEARKLASGYPTLLIQQGKDIHKLAAGYFNLQDMVDRIHYVEKQKGSGNFFNLK